MTVSTASTYVFDRRFLSVIGRFGKSVPGPLVIAIGGLHANETSGVVAARRVLDKRVEFSPMFSGTLLGLTGNRPALARGERCGHEDLNRIWFPERLRFEDFPAHHPRSVDEVEQREILQAIKSALDDFNGTAYFLDLHTTSALGAPFAVLAATLSNRKLAERLPGAMVLGLEEHLDGTLFNYVNELGHVAIGFEGGLHGSPPPVDAQELALCETLVMDGCIQTGEVPDLSTLTETVEERVQESPRVVEIRHRHPVEPEDGILMKAGFENLQRIKRGQVLARDKTGEILSSEDGRILMSLHQSQGSDGFFVVREVRSFWLTVAVWMRRFHLERILPLMPGVEPHPALQDTLSLIVRWPVGSSLRCVTCSALVES